MKMVQYLKFVKYLLTYFYHQNNFGTQKYMY